MSKEDFNELRDILLEASGVFLEYALIHNKKGNDDKSTRNNILSEKQDRALKLLRGIYQERTFTKEDAEKAAEKVLQELFNSHKPNKRPLGESARDLAIAALNAIGKIEE